MIDAIGQWFSALKFYFWKTDLNWSAYSTAWGTSELCPRRNVYPVKVVTKIGDEIPPNETEFEFFKKLWFRNLYNLPSVSNKINSASKKQSGTKSLLNIIKLKMSPFLYSSSQFTSKMQVDEKGPSLDMFLASSYTVPCKESFWGYTESWKKMTW